MAERDVDEQIEDVDPLKGAVEHDGTKDAFWEASEEIDETLGLDDGEPMPNDTDAADDAMP